MRHCPQCGVEYEDSARECVNCRVALVRGANPDGSLELGKSEDLKLVTIRPLWAAQRPLKLKWPNVFLNRRASRAL